MFVCKMTKCPSPSLSILQNRHVLDTLHRQIKIFIESRQKVSFKPNEDVIFHWNSQAILKIIVDLQQMNSLSLYIQ